mmetsp:Transcript_63113/g.176523  ORF Transcript_63113/g.176523 Transcript_63113/m.176523 type:complete len:316 (+) Transcript_63113:940-1887(+)
MSSDLVGGEAVLRIADEPSDEIPGLLPHVWVGGHLEVTPPILHPRSGDRRIVHLVAERRTAEEHFEHDDADGPPVALLPIHLLPVHLRPHVIGRAHDRLQLGPGGVPPTGAAGASVALPEVGAGVFAPDRGLGGTVLAKAEVQQVDVAVRVEDDVVGLDVPVDVLQVRVDVVHSLDELRDVEPRLVLVEGVLPHEVRHEVTPRQVIHDHVQVVVVLERIVQAYHPLFLRLAQRGLLRADVVNLVLVDHVSLAHLLHRINLSSVLLPAEPHDAKGACSDDLDGLEVGDADLLAALPEELILLPVEVLLHGLTLLLR